MPDCGEGGVSVDSERSKMWGKGSTGKETGCQGTGWGWDGGGVGGIPLQMRRDICLT